MSQRELAAASGVSHGAIAKIETGLRDTAPAAATVARLAAALGCDGAWLLTGAKTVARLDSMRRSKRIDEIGARVGADPLDIERTQAIQTVQANSMSAPRIEAELEAQHRARLYVDMVVATRKKDERHG